MKTLFTNMLFLIFASINIMANPLNLTQEEKYFIQENPIIKIGMLSNFAPFSYKDTQETVGLEHDLLKIISEKTGLKFEKELGDWPVIYNDFKDKKLDVIASISKKPFREVFTQFTDSYHHIPTIIFIRDDFKNYRNISSLKNKKVGVITDTFYLKELKKTYDLNLVYYTNYEHLTKDLVFGKIDAIIQNLPTVNYFIKKHAFLNIRLAQELILPNTHGEDLRFGIQPDKLLLSSIFQKVLHSISLIEKERLKNKWIGSIKQFKEEYVVLQEDEISYLDTQTIKYCINPNALPFEGLNKKGENIGMSSNYYKLFANMLSANFELVKTQNWKESLQYINEGKCDMLALIKETEERKKNLRFTSHYVEVPLVIATKLNIPFINDLEDLEDSKIGVVKGYSYTNTLRKKYPSLKIIEVNNITDGLDQVKKGKLVAFIDPLASIGYQLQKNYFGQLKIAGKLSETLKLSIGVQKDEDTLFNILQKTIKSIKEETHKKILLQTIPIKYEKIVNYDSIWKIALGSLILILLIIYWNTKILKANKLLIKAQEEIKLKNIALENLATTDKLTNIYNRRKIEEILQEEIYRSERFEHTFVLILLDIDYFKDVNDTYGHQIGDVVLIELAKILKGELRKTDFVGRFGGEEFLLICPESNIKEIYTLIEGLRIKIANTDFEVAGKKTASFGMTQYKKNDTVDFMIKRTDDALYKAKNNGRNKIEVNF